MNLVDPTGEMSDDYWFSQIFQSLSNQGYNNIYNDIQNESNAYKSIGAKISSISVPVAQNAPYTGEANDLYSAALGKDLYSGQKLTREDRVYSGLAFFIPYVSGSGIRTGKNLVGNFSEAQLKNFKRFIDKIPANSKNTIEITKSGNNFIMKATSAGNVPGSSAVYEKIMNEHGQTINYLKTTFDPLGNIVHIKDKLTGKTITPK